jgi:putative transcriptional regulator
MTSRQTLTGRLLVATPALADPNFKRAVVLILDHDNDGALGVVVNRPTEVAVTDILPMWEPVVSGPDVVFQGGPVSLDSALGLVAVPPGDEPIGVRRLHNSFGLVDLDTPPEVVLGGVLQMRIFAGYAGWSPDQLESEIADGAWYVVDAETSDPFTPEPKDLWRMVLRRQTGPLAMVATFPPDPSLN